MTTNSAAPKGAAAKSSNRGNGSRRKANDKAKAVPPKPAEMSEETRELTLRAFQMAYESHRRAKQG